MGLIVRIGPILETLFRKTCSHLIDANAWIGYFEGRQDFGALAKQVAQELDRLHGDPFDRIQIIQARLREWKISSRNPVFDRYGLSRVW